LALFRRLRSSHFTSTGCLCGGQLLQCGRPVPFGSLLERIMTGRYDASQIIAALGGLAA
jgi:hypothetical protein